MKRVKLLATIFVFAILIPGFSWGYEDPTPPADWDYGSHTVDGPVTRGINADYEIIWTGELSNFWDLRPDGKRFLLIGSGINDSEKNYMCIGILKYKTHAFNPDSGNVEPGYSWAFFATRRHTDPNDPDTSLLTCSSLTSTGLDPKRPVLVFLHGYPGEGSFFTAIWNALYIETASSSGDPYPFVISMSGPGAGDPVYGTSGYSYDCVDRCNTSDQNFSNQPPECRIPCELGGLPECDDDTSDDDATEYCLDDIRSVGYGFDPQPWAFRQGFPGIGSQTDPEPDKSYFWAYADSAQHLINIVEKGLSLDTQYGGLGWTSNNLMIGGYSAGGITSFLVNGADPHSILKGLIGIATHGGLRTSLNNKGDWLADTIGRTSLGGTYNPAIQYDCDAVEANPQNPPGIPEQVCQVLQYFDPSYSNLSSNGFLDIYPPQHPIFNTTGAFDEPFTAAGYQDSYNAFSDYVDVYRNHQADSDHKYFIGGGSYDAYWNMAPFCYETGAFNGYCQTRKFGMNEQDRSAGFFFNAVTNNREYPARPDGPSIWDFTDNGGDYYYQMMTCWLKTLDPAPDYVRFNVTLSRFWDILPSCENTGTLLDLDQDEKDEWYLISSMDYKYNESDAACEFTYQEQTGKWTYAPRCFTSITSDGGLGFTGVKMDSQEISYYGQDPDVVDCAKFGVVIDHLSNPNPDNFAAWVSFRYEIDGHKITSSSDINFYKPKNPPDRTSCVRPRDSVLGLTIDSDAEEMAYSVTHQAYGSNDIAGRVYNAFTGEVVPFATVEVRDNDSGDLIDSAQADVWGWAKVEDVEESLVIVQVSAEGYLPSVEYNFPVGAGWDYRIFPTEAIDAAYTDMDLERDPDMATFSATVAMYIQGPPRTEYPIGCGAAVFSTGTVLDALHYFDQVDGHPYPTTARDTSAYGTEYGQGTSPIPCPGDLPNSAFLAFNLAAGETEEEPGATTLNFWVNGGENPYHTWYIPYVCAGCFIEAYYGIEESNESENPTPTWCTE